MSAKKHSTESREFPGPWVRVRGRLTREGVATFSPCIRTFKGPPERRHLGSIDVERAMARREVVTSVAAERPRIRTRADQAGGQIAVDVRSIPRPNTTRAELADVGITVDQRSIPRPDDQIPWIDGEAYEIRFEAKDGALLESAPTAPRFYARDAAWASFGGRLPYHPKTERVVLRLGRRELGVMPVPLTLPQFDLVAPLSSADIDTAGIVHLAWRQDAADKKANKAWPLTYYVRYVHDDGEGLRPGVNLSIETFDLDLRGLQGGKKCAVQILATNGYQTSYVETPTFEMASPGPTVMLGNPDGPDLFVQGFSPNHGALIGEAITWVVDGKPRATGGTFDARILGEGDHDITVIVRDRDGLDVRQEVGRFDGRTGRLRMPRRGL